MVNLDKLDKFSRILLVIPIMLIIYLILSLIFRGVDKPVQEQPVVVPDIVQDITIDPLEVKYDSLMYSGIVLPYELFLDIESTNREFNIPDSILYRLINRESLFDTRAQSNVGAYGLMQIMPNTFKDISRRLGRKLHRDNYMDNLYAGMWYLNHLHNRVIYSRKYNDEVMEWKITLAAYNAGWRNASYALYNFNETINYVKYILQT